MDIISRFWGSLSYVGAVWVAALLSGYKLPRRKFFLPAAVLLGVALCAVSDLLLSCSRDAFGDGYLGTLFSTLNCFMVFLAAFLCMRLVYVCDWWQALFCATAGYCMEHMSQRASLFALLPFSEPGFWAEAAVLVAIRALFYVGIFFIFIRRVDLVGRLREGKIQIVISMIAILLTVFINSFSSRMATELGAQALHPFLWTFSFLASVLVLFVEFYQFAYKNAEAERDFLKVLMQQENEQYHREKSTIDVLNVKCHDLKHQLASLERRWGKEELRDIRQAVDAYDSFFQTGNAALDTVLSVKKLVCEDKKIELTCLADGKVLSFFSDADLYSLFGNILDNAIEAVEGFEEADKRIVSLTVREKCGFIFIHEENFCRGDLRFSDGLPISTKEDKIYHGFGLNSVRMIAQKYNGSCAVKVQGNFFYVDLMFPRHN